MPKTLILSVGGALSPLIYSINQHKPDYIIFFASAESKGQIPEILRSIGFTPKGTDIIVTESAENINHCLRKLKTELPQKLKSWKVEPAKTIIDYTGGTKSMSAALVLSTIDLSSTFSYIGGFERDKGGIGLVLNGQEKGFYTSNPWEELALEEKKKINLLFNTARYQRAKEVAERAKERVTDKEKPLFEILGNLIEGFMYWDSFRYRIASNRLNRAFHHLKIYCSSLNENHPCLALLKSVEINLTFLNQIDSENNLILDLISNAKRRAKLEGRYDDALVRLYRTFEKKVQIELRNYRIDTSNVNIELVPLTIQEEIKNKYFNEKKGRIETPLYASCQILKEIEKTKEIKGVGHKFFEMENDINNDVMNLRNKCIIIHGDNPIDEQKYTRAYNQVLNFLEIEEEDIPQFPELNI